jgi:hypothetical protein
MFKVVPNPTFEASVTLISHGEEQKLNVTFRAKPVKEYQALLDTIKAAKPKDVRDAITNVFLELTERWDADMELGKDAVDALHEHRPGAVFGLIDAYGEKMIVARKGN